MPRHVLFALIALLLTSPALHADETLYRLISERLSWMKAVAAWKYERDLPIENLAREAVVIRSATDVALRSGITTDSAARFFARQIEAAKSIQACWYTRWSAGGFEPTLFDLSNDIRPELLELGQAITEQLAQSTHDRQQFDTIVAMDCLTAEAREAVYEALQQVETYPNRLTQIQATGQLRVGTTGDYAPFSFSADGETFTGIDIDLARDLAASLDAELVFFHTSWPTLMTDLEAGYFDIGMSGISKIPAREAVADFTAPYHIGGKTPIARCGEAQKFNDLTAIDQPGVTLIVNPGGTNERFIRQHIEQAEIRLFNDNRAIFQEIAEGRADLMITDSIEVRLQTATDPRLCATMPGKTLTYQEKAYMMPKDPALQSRVNEWLESVRASGELTRTFETHLR